VAQEENAARNNAEAGSVRNAIRWGLFLAAVGTVGFRLPRLVGEFRQWRDALRGDDAVGAQNWQTILKVDAVASLVVLALGFAAFYFLRSRKKAAQ
jgi:H+/Cl- antiporter ClcA